MPQQMNVVLNLFDQRLRCVILQQVNILERSHVTIYGVECRLRDWFSKREIQLTIMSLGVPR